ncbi:MAG: AI-2E family transporter [Bacteroidales bacterium]|nr:AI-2E family transporter [Bacteroidales bacterium]
MKERTFGQKVYTFDRVIRMTLGAITFGAIIALIYILRNVLLPFGVAVVIAYLLEPIVQFIRQRLKLKGRGVAVFLTLAGATLALCLLAWLLVPSIVEEMHQVGKLISVYLSSEQNVPFIHNDVHLFIKENLSLDKIGALLTNIDISNATGHVMSLVNSSIGLIISICNWLLTFLYIIFIMLDYERLNRGLRAMVPQSMRHVAFTIGRDVKDSMNRYFRGQALIACCVGILFSIGFLIIDLPLAIVLGIIIGILNLVPYLQAISIPFTGLLCLVYSMESSVNFWEISLEAVAVYIIVQTIQDLVLTPHIMGKAMNLNPAIILLSLSIWGTLLGLLGMIIALPMTTLLLSYYERYVIRRTKESPQRKPSQTVANKQE